MCKKIKAAKLEALIHEAMKQDDHSKLQSQAIL
jgi:hypothetical protein